MSVFLRRAFSGATLALFAATVTATPVVLDTEQKAAAGVAAALFKAETPRQVNGAIESVLLYADATLRIVNAATTPAALLSTPGGITINCSISGTLRASMADTQPRVLRVRWTDCQTRLFGFLLRTMNGPVAITLPADTFRPEKLLAVRFGNASGEFLLQHRSESPDQNSDSTEAFKIALRGDMSLTVGTSTFIVNGYYDQRTMTEFPIGTPAQFYDYKMSADRLAVVRSRTGNDAGTLDDDDTLYERGTVSVEQTQPPPWGTWTDAYRFNHYRVHRITDYEAWTDTLSVDGRLDVTWNRHSSAGCMSGPYVFRTRVPLLNPLDTALFESGELVVNSVVTKFYSAANTPPALPTPVNGMLVSMRVRDVGTFNYDVGNWLDAVFPAGQCP